MANVRRLAEMGLQPPLAKEIATQIDGAIAAKIAVVNLMSLTDASGGTANNAIELIPAAVAATTDTSAASLVSVNAMRVAVQNDVADLAAKLNAVIAALKA